MKSSQQLNLRVVKEFLEDHHPFIFIAFILLVVTGSVFSLYQIFDSELNVPTPTTSTIADFDQATISKINNLRDSSDEPEPLAFPSPRANPFVQ